ncbi:hypothetical protein [Micromonospora endophytica]|uniref:hypothetical protein n=1 Tax=Micromonospora endophytica TaxID=515350 RepID=UPI001BB3BA3F|nr:hypothetical protein [Micromonospora endophytica]
MSGARQSVLSRRTVCSAQAPRAAMSTSRPQKGVRTGALASASRAQATSARSTRRLNAPLSSTSDHMPTSAGRS